MTWKLLEGQGPRWVGFGLSEDPWVGRGGIYDPYKDPAYDDSAWSTITLPASSANVSLVLDPDTFAWSARAFLRYKFTSGAGLFSALVDTAPQTYVYLDGVWLAELNTSFVSSPQTYARTITAGDHLLAVYWASQETFHPPAGANGFVNVTPSFPDPLPLAALPDTALTAEVRSEARLVPGIRMDGG